MAAIDAVVGCGGAAVSMGTELVSRGSGRVWPGVRSLFRVVRAASWPGVRSLFRVDRAASWPREAKGWGWLGHALEVE